MHSVSQQHQQHQHQLPEQQQTYLGMRMPMRQHHAQQRYLQHHHQRTHQQHQQLARGNSSVSSERDYAGPLAHHDRKAAHDLSDDGETSSAASEDSTASFSGPSSAKGPSSIAAATHKRDAEPSSAFSLPPSQRPRTTFHRAQQQQQEIIAAPSSQEAAGCLPVSSSSGGTFFERGTGRPQQQQQQPQQQQQQQQEQEQQPRQLPRLAALETLLSSHAQQQDQGSQTWQHGGLPTTRLLKTNGAGQMRLGQQQTLPSISRSVAASSSPFSSPTGSPGLRSSSPPSNLQHQHQRQQQSIGRYQPPMPACIQGSPKETALSAAPINHQHQHWLVPAPTATAAGADDREVRRQVPRINALSANSDSNNTVHGSQQRQAWGTAAPASEPVASWPKPAGGSGDIRVFRQQTTVPYTNAAGYGYRHEGRVEERGSNWPRQQQQQQNGASPAWSPQERRQHVKVIQHPSDTAPTSAAVLVSSSSSSSRPASRTPSPVSISSFRQGQQQPYQRQHHQRATAASLTSTASSFAPPASSSPEKRARGEGSWTPPAVVVDDAGQRRGAASSVHSAADVGGRGGKWDEEAQAQASGSIGKQILQHYLTHLYPKASREVWSNDEEQVLWRAQKEYGNAWSYISSLLPGRSENAVKNHWYTQMRMFIGQRGNNASKPCPPPSAKGGTSAKNVGSKAGGGGNNSRQARRKFDDFKSDAAKEQQQQRCATTSPPPAGTPAVATHSTAASPASASSSTTPAADAETVAKPVDEPAFDDKEESQARADAVAALGMLFSQGNGAGAGVAADR